MALHIAGIDKWAAGIRNRMSNDPGRQDLDDHILCNGFLFLDEYLEDILLGARSEPIIELTKTPGRRKDTSKKDRVATAASVKTLNSPDKENVPVLQSPPQGKRAPTWFSKALLKRSWENKPKSFSQSDDPSAHLPIPSVVGGNEQDEQEVAVLITPPSSQAVVTAEFKGSVLSHSLSANDASKSLDSDFGPPKRDEQDVAMLITPPSSQAIVTTESKGSVLLPPLSANDVSKSLDSDFGPPERDGQDVVVLITPPSSQAIVPTEFKGSVLLPSLSANDASKSMDSDFGPLSTSNAAVANPGVDLSVIAEDDESAMLQASLHPIRPTGPIIRDKEISYHIPTDPSNPNSALSTITVSYDPNADDDDDDTNAFPAAFHHTFNESEPTSTASSFPIDPYARDYETHELPQMEAEHPRAKQPQPQALTRKANLPDPSPLRKSTREPVNGNTRPSTATAAVTGMRTSWLKTRDITAKHASVVSGVKRKSDDLTGETHDMTTKVAKTNADGGVSDVLSSKERREGKLPIQPFRPVPFKAKEQSEISVASPDGNAEGMMNMLKRTVEGLGTRVGKSIGKSLGGAAATAAAAEAKAAAEARLAQREAKGSDGTRQGRLSVSDLVGTFDTGAASKGKEQENSDSKTKGKPEPVKSIQLAAAAAKKQQEEADRKTARLREMDKRRAAIASKKADQDTAEKLRHQGDRHKRERDEGPERVAKTAAKKVEEEIAKKRKVVVELEKKPQGKKPLSKENKELGSSRIGKLPLSTSLSQSQVSSIGAFKSFKQPGIPASVSQPSVKLVGVSQEPKSTALSKAASSQDDVRQPSQTLHAQMQARVEAQMMQAKQKESLIPSESIELPDINSEYSNSDDENRPRTFDPPDWAQSPILGVALQSQSRLNPDDIFGPVKPLRMEEIFTTRHSRFRARTSSANWAGTDELTTDERREYAKRMGYLN